MKASTDSMGGANEEQLQTFQKSQKTVELKQDDEKKDGRLTAQEFVALPPTLFKQWQRKIGGPTHAAGDATSQEEHE